MPRIKRWFPVSHDINSDPEVIELTETFGGWMFRVWLQMLSIADRNEGEITGKREWIATSMTWLFGSNSRRYNTEWRRNKLLMTFEWMSNKGWIRIELDKFVVLKYAKYHRSREPNMVPTRPDRTRPNLKRSTSAPSADLAKAKKKEPEPYIEPSWKSVADRIFAGDKFRYATLIKWIELMRKEGFSDRQVETALTTFEPHANDPVIEKWWGYLTKVLREQVAKANGNLAERQGEQHKREEKEWLGKLVRK